MGFVVRALWNNGLDGSAACEVTVWDTLLEALDGHAQEAGRLGCGGRWVGSYGSEGEL